MGMIRRWIENSKHKRFLATSAQEYFIHENSDNNDIDIVTIAFNNDMVIKYQTELLKKYLKDEYYHTVVDNSNNDSASERIKNICIQKNIGYIKLTKNNFCKRPSMSHGIALNWVYYNFLLKRKLKYFGFIDHDIFPFKEISIIDKMEKSKKYYGLIEEREKRWYLWAGFCFFNFETVFGKKLDFRPGAGLDTGGSNWPILYENIDEETVLKACYVYEKLIDGDIKQLSKYQIIDDKWLHSFNASNWFKADSEIVKEKETALENLLITFL